MGGHIDYARVMDLVKGNKVIIYASTFVVCAGAVPTAQLLWNSKIRPWALGRYICEQPKLFCQVVLNEDIIDKITHHTYPGLTTDMKDRIRYHRDLIPSDPVPIPTGDKPPQVSYLRLYSVHVHTHTHTTHTTPHTTHTTPHTHTHAHTRTHR